MPPHADAIAASIREQIDELVRLPSRAGVDDLEPILTAIERWFRNRQIPCETLTTEGRIVGVYAEVVGLEQGPRYLLNAPVDTAEFGDETAWTYPPTPATVVDGWMYGRGTADSKAGIAIFCHVIAALVERRASLAGTAACLFDAEEHTGQFTGVRRFMDTRGKTARPDGVMIGYPGNDGIVIGCRGFFRVQLTVHGQLAHSGSSQHHGVNAIFRAATLVAALSRLPLPNQTTESFPLPPKLTVTAVRSNPEFSTVPDWCTINVDVRLTPSFTGDQAEKILRDAVRDLDRSADGVRETDFEIVMQSPAYRLPKDSVLARALGDSARQAFGRPVTERIVGPSSIGNFLATLGIEATSGFGVTYRDLHAANECIELASIPDVYRTYLGALERLLA